LHVGEEGRKAKIRTPLSLCGLGTLGKIEEKRKKKIEHFYKCILRVNYCTCVKQEAPMLSGICSSSCSGSDWIIKTLMSSKSAIIQLH